MTVALRSELEVQALVVPLPHAAEVELSVVMPCLNEAETVGTCIQKAQQAIEAADIAAMSRDRGFSCSVTGSASGSSIMGPERSVARRAGPVNGAAALLPCHPN